ncbi:hypothetical protein M3666_04570 [Curtobacterium sp. ODYSSEY 48 V2]|jgi:hypothetical protein|uniref:hypothetical protein n=1 Tax=unclassified Curtobacterium TaxID=257496 RepID=UPI00232DF6C8|nr:MULTISPECIES: hypothetical protein [unclassified Curtobacterium]MCM3504390.1 hypothetical protein [Curtobacterium sp. ODYSSEY 48 V2]MDB6425591.1 hypothetical protein [Curtobacterium sp. 20TX0008]MDP9735276.1 hypothetical protein [Curtobacterium sp. 260]MDT0211174.1 hypothetical protein [Curtobacterium sp. BRD11]
MTATGAGLAAWPPVAVAAVVAAAVGSVLTLVGAAVGGVWALVRWRRDVGREERDRAWARFVWTVDQVCDGDVGRAEVGRFSARAMSRMQILRADDAAIGKIVLDLITEGNADGSGRPGGRAHRTRS